MPVLTSRKQSRKLDQWLTYENEKSNWNGMNQEHKARTDMATVSWQSYFPLIGLKDKTHAYTELSNF